MRIGLGERLGRALGGFARERSGSVATIVAVSAIPILIATGVGFDLSRAMAARTHLQDAVDSAALALAHLPAGTPQATLDSTAKSWITANLNDPSLGQTPSVTVTPGTGQIDVDASAYVNTTLTSIIGYNQLPISGHSTVKWGTGHVEVVLVLDNTGSMAQNNKLTNMVAAAKSLVSTLLAANTPGDPNAVKIAVVPFSNTVNIGATYQTATWMDPIASAYRGNASYDIFDASFSNSALVNRFTLFQRLGTTWSGCVETRPQWVSGVDQSYDITDAMPDVTKPGTQIVPFFAPDEPDSGNGNDYIDDGPSPGATSFDQLRDTDKYYNQCTSWKKGVCQNYKSGTPILRSTASATFGPNDGCGIIPVQRLTTSASTLTSVLNQMVAAGSTNVPIGLFWGWMTLSPSLPFGDGVAYGTSQVKKIVILLTDGANTGGSEYAGMGYQWQRLITNNSGGTSNPTSTLNDREAKLCANMKAKDIKIYSIAVEVTDTTAKSLLQGCATQADYYIDASSSSQLQAAFANIAGSIGKLRIAQ